MTNPKDILAVALIILAAFLIGATVGAVLRLIFARPKPTTADANRDPTASKAPQPRAQVRTAHGVLAAANDAAPSTETTAAEDGAALIAALAGDPIEPEPGPQAEPAVQPEPVAQTEPVSAAEVPAEIETVAAVEPVAETEPMAAVDPVADTVAETPVEPGVVDAPAAPVATDVRLAPARKAGETLSGRLIAFFRAPPGAAPVIDPVFVGEPAGSDASNVVPFRRLEAEPEAELDQGADEAPSVSETLEPVVLETAADPLEDVREALVGLEGPAADVAPENLDLVADEAEAEAEAEDDGKAEAEVLAETEAVAELTALDEDVAPPPRPSLADEQAAMRAIEGTWEPPAEPVAAVAETPEIGPEPEVFVEAVAEAEPVTYPGYAPPALAEPLNGRADPLIYIVGIFPETETRLNALGLFHFDQVASLTNDNVEWLEAKLGLTNRIVPELWREQARELAAMTRSRRA